MVCPVRIALALVLVAGTANAEPLAADVDGDGVADKVDVDPNGQLRIETKRGASTVALGAKGRAALASALVGGVPTIVVQTPDEGIVVQLAGGAWKQTIRIPLAGGGLDADYGYALDARPEGIYRYQTRGGYRRCDGQPALLFAELWSHGKFQ